MKIIVSPAKKMKENTDDFSFRQLPLFLDKAQELRKWMLSLSYEERKALWACSDKIARENSQLLEHSELTESLSPALLTYVGIQYQTMSPSVFTDEEFAYIEKHLRILSGFYGVLRPFDGIRSYRLEMQAKGSPYGGDLYSYWGDALYKELTREGNTIVNLASGEYSKAVEKYLQPEDRFITMVFAEKENGRLVTKGVYAKMARGEMVRFMAEKQIMDPDVCREFHGMGYAFDAEASGEDRWVFTR